MESRCPICLRPYGIRGRCYHCGSLHRRKGETRSCGNCGNSFYVSANQIALIKGGGTYCSNACKYVAMRGRELKPGGRYTTKAGYVAVKTGVDRYELEHRLVMEASIGRALATSEHVHHVNGVKDDNRRENLRILSNTEHQKLHDFPQTKPRRIDLVCASCGREFQRPVHRITSETNYCSRACHAARGSTKT